MIRFLILTAALVLFAAQPAQAGFIAAAFAAIAGWFAAASPILIFGLRIVAGLALTALQRALQKRKQNRPEEPGIKTSVTLDGGANPDGLIMGTYATAGALVAPWVMFGPRNDYNAQVIDLSGVPLSALRKVYVNGSIVDFAAGDVQVWSGNAAVLGRPALGDYAGHLWIKFYDGTQTVADPGLVGVGAADPDFPWSPDMVGINRAYVICYYKYNREIWQGAPQFKFEVGSARFYDMRKDTSKGGVGAHRLDNPATWEPTDNPMVAVSHLALGYILPDGTIYGGGYTLADLPLSDWAAAMNACDAAVDKIGGGTEPAWRAGLEILFDEEPIEAINSLLQACDGEIADVGGTLYPKVGAPGLPVAFVTDADLIVSEPEELDPFPGLQETVNGVAITFPDPAANWETREAPRILSPDLEAEDGARRLLQSLALPACPYAAQVQRLGQALVRDARRFARHTLHLPGDLAFVKPLQTISWTSSRNGYSGKLFEVSEQAVDLYNYQSQVTVREVDPSDYDPTAYLPGGATLPPSVTPVAPVALEFAGAVPWSLDDANGPRRPAIRAFWEPLSSSVVEIEVTRAGIVVSQVTAPSTAGEAIIAGIILPNETYSVRLRVEPSGRASAWAGPFVVTTPDLRFTQIDIADVIQSQNYVPLEDGWQINQNGDAEFNNLLVRREMIVLGAVSDVVEALEPWEVTAPIFNTNLQLGPGLFVDAPDLPVLIFLRMEFRDSGQSSVGTAVELQLYRNSPVTLLDSVTISHGGSNFIPIELGAVVRGSDTYFLRWKLINNNVDGAITRNRSILAQIIRR